MRFSRELTVLVALVAALCAACGGGASNPDKPAESGDSWLRDITGESGVDFTYDAGPTGVLHMPEVMGSGLALFDADNDGDLDLYFTNGNHLLPEQAAAAEPADRYYRQEGGKFVDATVAAGLTDGRYGMGAATGDFDNDGFVDLYVTNFGPNRLWRNRGDGRFEDVTARAGVAGSGWASSATFLDFDRDGQLDLFVTRYVEYRPAKRCFDDAGRADYCGPLAFPPVHDLLFHNNGDGTFADVSAASGIAAIAAAGLGVVADDFNEDGWPDVYVANDAYANHMWINQHDGTFREEALLLGVALNLHGQAEASMGVLAADLDNDLDIDLFMTHLVNEKDTLYRNLGVGGGFVDASGEAGIAAVSMDPTGFGTVAFDVELDGDLDLFVGNGRVRVGEPLRNASVGPPWDVLAEVNAVLLNDGSGRFKPGGAEFDELREKVEVTRGAIAGDLDRDGDLDLVISNIGSPARIYRNDAPRQGHWLLVRARDPRWSRDALGARVVVLSGERRFTRTIQTASSYQSSGPPEAHFGLGSAGNVESIEVRWPDGLRERFPGGPTDRSIDLVRGTGEPLQ